jgi:predicted HicB family RNase H-like nuclease
MNDLLHYKEYLASVHFSSEDEVFYGKILGVSDLVSFEGVSVRELKKSFRDAVEDYLAACQKAGKEPDKTYKGSFNIRVPSKLHREAAIYSASQNISLNDFVRQALEFTLNHVLNQKNKMA